VEPGRVNALAQALLQLTVPGVPDTYQGTELWDLSLVDPDNRRPVDFDLRRNLLGEVGGLSPEALLARTDEGLPKLRVVREALHLRRRRPELFRAGTTGAYAPLVFSGGKAEHAVGFTRGGCAAVVVPRLVLGLRSRWDDTVLTLPAGSWTDLLTGAARSGGTVEVSALLASFPVALLERSPDA